MKDENNDGVADIEDVKFFLKKNKANRIALKGNDQHPGGDFRSERHSIVLNVSSNMLTHSSGHAQ